MSRASLGEAHSKIRFTKPFPIKKKKPQVHFQSSQNLKLTLYKEIAAETKKELPEDNWSTTCLHQSCPGPP